MEEQEIRKEVEIALMNFFGDRFSDADIEQLDSLEGIQLAMELEEKFAVEVEDEEVEETRSINAIVDLIKKKKHEQRTHSDC